MEHTLHENIMRNHKTEESSFSCIWQVSYIRVEHFLHCSVFSDTFDFVNGGKKPTRTMKTVFPWSAGTGLQQSRQFTYIFNSEMWPTPKQHEPQEEPCINIDAQQHKVTNFFFFHHCMVTRNKEHVYHQTFQTQLVHRQNLLHTSVSVCIQMPLLRVPDPINARYHVSPKPHFQIES